MRLPQRPDQPVVYLEATIVRSRALTWTRGGHDDHSRAFRPCGVFDWKFTVLSHNTIRGAAGAALLNAELLKAQGYLG